MTPLIVSLKGPGVKMSASIPESRILVHDSVENINNNINRAYCPSGIVQDNPALQLAKFIVFGVKSKMTISRDKKFGGDVTYTDYAQLERDFAEKKLHPTDLKNALTQDLIVIFKKARKYFEKHPDLIPLK